MLSLHPRQWFIWRQLSPDGLDAPWRDQLMLVNGLTPLKTGQGRLSLNVTMLPRPLDPITLDAVINVSCRSEDVLIGEWHALGDPQVTVAISNPEMAWLEQHAAWVFQTRVGYCVDHGTLNVRELLEDGLGTDPDAIVRGAAADLREFELPPLGVAVGRTSTDLHYEGLDAFLILHGVSSPRHPTKWNIYRDGNTLIVRRASNNEIYWIAEFEPCQPLGAITITRLTVNLRSLNMSPDVAIAEFDRVLRSAVLRHDVDWPLDPETPQQIRDAWVARDPDTVVHFARRGADLS